MRPRTVSGVHAGLKRTTVSDDPAELATLVEAMTAVEAWLDSTPHALIGGVAVAFRGRSRTTIDVDGIVSVSISALSGFIERAADHGLHPRFDNEVEFARRNLVVRLVHKHTAVDVDISLALSSFELEAIQRAVRIRAFGSTFTVLETDDLLIMKAFARRGRDLGDIEGILDRHPDVDLRRVRDWLQRFGEALDDPTYLSDFDAQVVRAVQSRRRRSVFGGDSPPTP